MLFLRHKTPINLGYSPQNFLISIFVFQCQN